MGYNYTFLRLLGAELRPVRLYRCFRKIGARVSFASFLRALLLAVRMVHVMDGIDEWIRENIGFQRQENAMEELRARFLGELEGVRSFLALERLRRKYRKALGSVEIDRPQNRLKVGVVGELYTLMEPFSNFFLEKELARRGVQVSRNITVTYLLFQKSRMKDRVLRRAGKYLKFAIGADGTDSVERGRILAEKGYDGLIHVKPFGCMPEVNAMPMLKNIGNDYGIPVLYFSFDSQTSETGVQTRLEAFCDMLMMRKEKSAHGQNMLHGAGHRLHLHQGRTAR